MAKKSRKRSVRSRKENAGCMWGLISLFDFRQAQSPRKLLSDKKRGSGRHGSGSSKDKLELLKDCNEKLDDINWHNNLQLFEDSYESGSGSADLSMTSIKELMDEEISVAQPTKKISFDENQSDLELEADAEKTHKKPSNNPNAVSDVPVNDFKVSRGLNPHLYNPNQSERCGNFDLASFMQELYSHKPQCGEEYAVSKTQIDLCGTSLQAIDHVKHECNEPDFELPQKHALLLKALGDVAEAFLSHKFIDEAQLKGKRAFDQSKEFMDALEVLNSNRELFIKLLQDPNSLLLKHIQDLQNGKLSKLMSYTRLEGTALLDDSSNSGKGDESANKKVVHKQNGLKFFRKKDKSTGTKASKASESSQGLNRIVILKPVPARLQNPSDATKTSSSPRSNHSLKSQEDRERDVSLFSVKELKRRLRNAVGDSKKERHRISVDGVLHKIPYGSKDLGEVGKHIERGNVQDGLALKTSAKLENTSHNSALAKKRFEKVEPGEFQPDIDNESAFPKAGKYESLDISILVNQNGSSIYEEAKKHLAEMLDTGGRKDVSPNRQTKTLGRILSLPEYSLLSPKCSPGGDMEIEMSPRQIIFSPRLQLKLENATSSSKPSRQNLEGSPCTDSNQDDNSPRSQLVLEDPLSSSSPSRQILESSPCTDNIQDDESQMASSNQAILEIQVHDICIGDDTHPDGSMQIKELADDVCMGASTNLVVPSERNDESSAIVEKCKEERSSATSESDLAVNISEPETLSVSHTPTFLLATTIEAPESIMEKYERPSPVSVLEPLFSEDIFSPERESVEQTELPVEPRQLVFEECESLPVFTNLPDSDTDMTSTVDNKQARFEYVRTVLEASDLNSGQILGRWQSSCQPLDPSLFDEVGISYCQLLDDPKLLFDCIDEVLLEVQDKYFVSCPWLSFLRLNARCVPRGEAFIQEVFKGIDWYFQVKFPSSLDQIVGKDLQGGAWLDVQFEIEDMVFEMEDDILEELMEETLAEWWISSLSL